MTDQPLEPGERPSDRAAPDDTDATSAQEPAIDEPATEVTGAEETVVQEPAAETAAAEETVAQEPPPAWPAPERRLWRSRDDRVIAGVCGGLGRYLGMDPVLIRIAAVVLIFAGGAGLLVYGVCWLVIPEEPEDLPGETRPPSLTPERSGAVVLGLVFVVLGAFFLMDKIWPDFLSWQYIWPVALIAVGLAVLLRAKR